MVPGDGLDIGVKEKKFPGAVSDVSNIIIMIYPVYI